MKHKLNIYGTLGPSCADKQILIDLFRAGMTGIRLNLSHCRLTEREDWLAQLYAACDELRIVPDFLVDLQGPELRIGKLETPLSLKAGDMVTLVSASYYEDLKKADLSNNKLKKTDLRSDDPFEESPAIPCPDLLFSYLDRGQLVKLDDGKIFLEILGESADPSVTPQSADRPVPCYKGQVRIGGSLVSGKSLAIDGISIPLPPLTDQDLETIPLLGRFRVTGVMQPFVRSKEDLIALRQELIKQDMDQVKILAKLETQEGVERLPEFLPFCDEVIIARGDLGNAVPLSKLPIIQKQASGICRMAKKPFMVVTQMLASMESHPFPTRAEVSDIANAVLDGASSIMLTGETAIGSYPVEAMRVFCETAYEAQKFLMTGREPLFFTSLQ